MGRPTKLTPDIQDKIVELVKSGCWIEAAAGAAGIGTTTFYRWMELGAERKDKETGRVLPPRKAFREFREAITRARHEAECAATLNLMVAAQNGDSKAAMFYLERSHKDRWGRTETIVTKDETKASDDRPAFNPDLLGADDLALLEQLLMKAMPERG